MPIVAAAVVPHSPLLIPSIAKEHAVRSVALVEILKEVGQDLYAAQPDTVVVLTPHGAVVPGNSCIEVADQLIGRLLEFGDVTTELKLSGAVGLSHRLKEVAEDAGLPLLLQTNAGLDYGVTIPWLTMWPEPVTWNVMPISLPAGTAEASIRLGEVLHDFLQSRPERTIVIASGDTNRRSMTMTDRDRRPTADERLVAEAITRQDLSRLTTMPANDICLREPLMALLACVNGLSLRSNLRTFDVPLTVGQVVAEFTRS